MAEYITKHRSFFKTKKTEYILETFFLKNYQELPLYNTGAVMPKRNVLTDYRCWQLHHKSLHFVRKLGNILFSSLFIDVQVRRATPVCSAYSISWMARSRSSQEHPFSSGNIEENLQCATHSRPNCGALQVTLCLSLVLLYCCSGSKISTYS